MSMQATKVWWDGEKLMAEPIPESEIYKESAQPQQEPETCANCKHNEWPFGVCDGCPKQSDESQTGNWEPEDKQPDYKALYERVAKQYNELAALMEQPAQQQEPVVWNVIDPFGKIVATEKDAIRGWARIQGYKPTVESLLGFQEQGWRVVPASPPPPQRKPLTDDEFISMVDSAGIAIDPGLAFEIKEMVEAAHGIKENT